jgi:hypothetical protein
LVAITNDYISFYNYYYFIVMVFWAGSLCIFIGYLFRNKRLTKQAATNADDKIDTTENKDGADAIETIIMANRPPYEPVTRTSPFAP